MRCLRVASKPVPMVQRLSPQLALIPVPMSHRMTPQLTGTCSRRRGLSVRWRPAHRLLPITTITCAHSSLGAVWHRRCPSRSAVHSSCFGQLVKQSHCTRATVRRPVTATLHSVVSAGRRSGRRVLNTLVGSSIAKSASPNPSVKPTHSGLRPPWAAYLTR